MSSSTSSAQMVRAVGITGTGSYAPERILSNADLEKMVDTTNEWILTRTGIRERHIARPDETTSDMGAEAARRGHNARRGRAKGRSRLKPCTTRG